MSTDDWRPVYSERFLDRAIQRPPRPLPPRPPLTDEEIALLPENLQPIAMFGRSVGQAFAGFRLLPEFGESAPGDHPAL